jgi:Amt family ammonium transporter
MIYNKKRQMSLNGFCTGVVAGLVAITPAAGFVSIHYSFLFGLFGLIPII